MVLVVGGVLGIVLAIVSVEQRELVPGTTFGIVLALLYLPSAVAMARAGHPVVRISDEELEIEHGGLFVVPIVLRRDQVHSLVPTWLRPGHPLLPSQPAIVPSRSVISVGDPGGRGGPGIAVVLRDERVMVEARPRRIRGFPRRGARVRGFLLAVEDLDAAQRFFQPWGLLARLTPGAFEWLVPKSTATSPGPEPVYGT